MADMETQNEEDYMNVEFKECVMDGKTIYQCSKCDKYFSDTQLLIEHYTSDHRIVTEGFQRENCVKCACCQTSFKAKHFLEKHTKSVHEENLINVFHKCLLCEKAFRVSSL